MTETMRADTFTLDRDRQAAPQVYEELRRRIITLQLEPGTPLSRIALMEMFGVSQTPIRDALLRLADEKLVDIFAQHATRVSAIDMAQVRQAQFLRQSVELEVVRQLAVQADHSALVPIRRDLERQKALLDSGILAPEDERDLTFHKRLCEAAGAAEIWALIKIRSGNLDRLRRLLFPKPERGLSDHLGVLSAIEARNADEAQRLLREHLTRTLSLVDEVRERHPTYLT
jgi:DNA-binding GntR family transcriptional regulator